MSNFFARQGASEKNELKQSLGALLGIAQGLVCDRQLNDLEIRFLRDWLTKNDTIAHVWPGDVVYARVRDALEDGVISEAERQHLTETLQQLIGGTLEEIAEPRHVTGLAFDQIASVTFPQNRFCLTGDFIFAPREVCAAKIEERGGIVSASVTKKLNYLVVGSRGSTEWKYGSFGTKVERTMEYRREGVPILIVREDRWVASL